MAEFCQRQRASPFDSRRMRPINRRMESAMLVVCFLQCRGKSGYRILRITSEKKTLLHVNSSVLESKEK